MPLLKLTLTATREQLPIFEEAMEPFAQAVSVFEIPDSIDWRVEAWCHDELDKAELEAQIKAAVAHLKITDLAFENVPQQDWLTLSYQSFPPLTAGRFFVHGSHFEGMPPEGKIPLLINAATAFGSGEHQSTFGCLTAITELAEKWAPTQVLDMGTGSGILAFAATKIWHVPAIGIDIDEESVRVAIENAEMNHVENDVTLLAGAGFATAALKGKKFDLILANILANPLCEMAPDLVEHADDKAYIILSGILNTQADMVIAAYTDQDTELVKHYKFGEWTTLLLMKKD